MNLKISQLQTYSEGEIRESDIFAVVDLVNGETKKITLSDLRAKMGSGLPSGGIASQVLVKNSSANGDASWITLSKASVGLSNVNNTSDIDKPVSTAVQAQLNLKAPLSMVSSKADKTYVDGLIEDLEESKQDKLTPSTDGYVLTSEEGELVWKLPPSVDNLGSVLYLGPSDEDGTWRIIVKSSGNLAIEKRVDGEWVLKDNIS